MQNPNSPYMNKRQAAAFLRCGQTKLNEILAKGHLKYKKLQGTILISRLDAAAYIEYDGNYRALTRPQKEHVNDVINTPNA